MPDWLLPPPVRRAPPLGHLFAYLLASNFLVPIEVPATLKENAPKAKD
jgi:hypothetical protein